ncbi:ABC transporter ATP-binding protein [Nocardioides pantholopis]|uniref:ABC transporter ATP-binding protein n=1 Tax=Nocardioides pantholopis TaxID=2483798 RepID=UPI000FDA4547|nr:ABC transporter ATP-binding protein [Nocardioides pantholopis]
MSPRQTPEEGTSPDTGTPAVAAPTPGSVATPAIPDEVPPAPDVPSVAPIRRLLGRTSGEGDRRRLVIVAAVVMSLVLPAFAIVQPLIVADLLDRLEAREPYGRTLTMLGVVVAGELALAGVYFWTLKRLAEDVILDTRRAIITRVLRMPVDRLHAYRSGDLMTRLGSDTTMMQSVFTAGIFSIISSATLLVGSMVVLWFLDPLLMAILVGTVLAVGVLLVFLLAAVRRVSRAVQYEVGGMVSEFETSLKGLRTIRIFGASRRVSNRVARRARRAHRQGRRLAGVQAVVEPTVNTAMQAAVTVVLLMGGIRVSSGAISVGELVAFVLYALGVVVPMSDAARALTAVQVGLAAVDRTEEITTEPIELADLGIEEGAAPDPHSPVTDLTTAPAVELRHVDFAYPDGEAVLHGVDLVAPTGDRVAIVGPSGSGKSTLLSLIGGLYRADGGQVMVGGRDILDGPIEEVRDRLAIVEQDAPMLAGTIRENLLLAAPDADDATLCRVLNDVGLGAFASVEGLDREVGEGGAELSGGQRQRLAWARALARNCDILLLDEPTSALDAQTEWRLQNLLNSRRFRAITVLVVAHRLSTVVGSDSIVVLDQGRVVATGTHDSLVETCRLYREFAARQGLADSPKATSERSEEPEAGGGDGVDTQRDVTAGT